MKDPSEVYFDRARQFNTLTQTILYSEIEGFFNLLFSHFLTLLPLDASETKEQLNALLQTVSSAEAPSSTKYRMYSAFSLSIILSDPITAFPTSSTLFLGHRA